MFRRFFLTGIAAMLTAGGTLGAVVLIRIAAHHSFTSVPIFDINAHAQAQIYGWTERNIRKERAVAAHGSLARLQELWEGS